MGKITTEPQPLTRHWEPASFMQFVNRAKTMLQYAGRFALIARSNREKSHPFALAARVGFLLFGP
jgi:tRNA1(Val) A37 N6-methylase TrmN6